VAPSEGSTDGSTTASAVTTTSLVPLTPDGLRTGPGVQTDHIALGLIVDPAVDRGFADGVRLWQSTVNRTTGICGRRIELTVRTASGVDATLTSYRELGPITLGLLTQTAPAVQSELATHIADDEIPVVTPTGRSADLSSWGPMVVGATDDILAINAESYLMQTGALASGGQLGVLSDGSAAATEAEAGLRWFAERSGVTLRTFATTGTADWSGVSAVMVLAGPDQTSQVLAATGPGIPVVTTMAGDQVSSLDPAQHGRLLVSTPTTALDSDNPAAQAVVTAYAAGGGTDPGPLLFAGWASGATWGRLLQQACSQADLTRSGIRTAATDLPPAPTDSLLGATDLRAIVNDGLPATRVSAMSAVDPNAVGGLTALTWLQAAPGITDYVPAG
jgi:ABC-type branched-subunit amino acid transport system substrate-binding protein